MRRRSWGLSSSNRLAIATQRTRELALQLESAETLSSDEAKNRFDEMNASAERSQLLIRALRAFYFAMGAFALATLQRTGHRFGATPARNPPRRPPTRNAFRQPPRQIRGMATPHQRLMP
jgi:hypothetical protein